MSRAILVYLFCLPLAVLMGFMLATPTDASSFGFVVMAFMVMTIPLLLKYHHFFVALTWNAVLIVFFLPGQPSLGLLVAMISLGIAIVERTMNKKRRFLSVPSITLPLILLTVIVLITAKLTGGIGSRVFGSENWGAKRYLGVFGAIIGYFALTSQTIPKKLAMLYISVFFLGGLTSGISDLIYMAGPSFYFLFVLFPSEYAFMQAMTADTLLRLSGLAFACASGIYFLFARFGIQGTFSLRRPWLPILFLLFVGGSLLGGYRALVILLALIFLVQFFVEGTYRTKLGPILIMGGLLAMSLTIAYIEHMPLSVQRAFSILPLENIDSTARADAMGTLDWRLTMWKILIPEVPKYLLLGKGYSFNSTDYLLTQEAVHKGSMAAYEDVLISGNYHNGVFTILIPFGIFGFGAFLWFAAAGVRLLSVNLRYGDPDLRLINTFLLTYFVARMLFYLIFYGQFDLDFADFTGAVGLSIAVNGGMLSSPAAEVAPEEVADFQPVHRAVAF
jgi:hypothetical protein